MLKNRHQPAYLFALVPQLGLKFGPQLEQLDRLLDDDVMVGVKPWERGIFDPMVLASRHGLS